MHRALFLIYPIELNIVKTTIYCIRKYRLFRPYPDFFSSKYVNIDNINALKKEQFFFIKFYINEKPKKSLALTNFFQISFKMCSPLHKAYLFIVKYILFFFYSTSND